MDCLEHKNSNVSYCPSCLANHWKQVAEARADEIEILREQLSEMVTDNEILSRLHREAVTNSINHPSIDTNAARSNMLIDDVVHLSNVCASLTAALTSIANNTCCGDCQEAKRVATKALDDVNNGVDVTTSGWTIARVDFPTAGTYTLGFKDGMIRVRRADDRVCIIPAEIVPATLSKGEVVRLVIDPLSPLASQE